MNVRLFLLFFLLGTFFCKGQYHREHFIAPAPWQYWSTANEIVIGTLSEETVEVELRKSDGTLLKVLEVTLDNPISYRFEGNAAGLPRNQFGETYTDRGLFINASEPVLVNLRNIASDSPGTFNTNIKGNASLVSFGDEGLGHEFRLGYYRQSLQGLSFGSVVFSVMATVDETTITLPTLPNPTVLTLNLGESRLFSAPFGTLLTSDKPVVMNVGSWGDTPQTCGSNGEDGTFDQIAPVNVLGRQYLVVRGNGTAPQNDTQKNMWYGSEQTMIIAAEDETVVTIQNYNGQGNSVGEEMTWTFNAGDFDTFYHGDGANQYSSSLIISNKPIIVYAGTAVTCETDISTVLPIGSCAGSTNIQTKKFINFNNANLPYFGFAVIEDQDTPVLLDGVDLETVTGIPRTPIGTSGFYMLRFNDTNIIQNGVSPENILLSSDMPLTTSVVQQGVGFSMSAFFSAFGEAAKPPTLVTENEDCTVTIEAQQGEDILKYEWFVDGVSIGETENHFITVKKTGNYTVRLLKFCGWSNMSLPTLIDIVPCSDLSITKTVGSVGGGFVEFEISITNMGPVYDDTNVVVNELLPSGYTFVSAEVTKGVYDEDLNQWQIPLLAVNEKAFLTLKVQIVPEGDYTNTATIIGENKDPNMNNNSSSAGITIEKFSFTKIALDKEYHDIDDQITYTMIVKNLGSNALRNITIEDVNADVGSIIPSFISNIEPGVEVEIIAKHTITEIDYREGEVVNQAKATAESVTGVIVMMSDDPSTPKTDDPTVTLLNREADIEIVKDNYQIYYKPGSKVDYDITIANNGPTSAVDLQVMDLVPHGVDLMSWSTSIGSSGEGNMDFTIPVLRVGEVVDVRTSLLLAADRKGDLINTVTYLSEIIDPSPECLSCTDMDIEEVIIPKGISPNGDGKNDFLDLERFHVAKLTVFNRYGQIVYEKEKYTNQWYGQSKSGVLLPSGTYFYRVSIMTGDQLTGWIQVNY